MRQSLIYQIQNSILSFRLSKKFSFFREFFIWLLVIGCTVLIALLCFNEALDWDEAFSYRVVHNNTISGIIHTIFWEEPSHPPLYYIVLRFWTWIFGESLLAFKLFSVAASLSTMILGASFIKKHWGYKSAILFILAAGLSPAVLFYNVNIRMYSWCLFFVVASALTAYSLIQKSTLGKWLLLSLCSLAGVYFQYFTVIFYVIIYIYLLLNIVFKKKNCIKYFVLSCTINVLGFIPCIPLLYKQISSDTSIASESKEHISTGLYSLMEYLFSTNILFSAAMGTILLIFCIAGYVFLRKRFVNNDCSFGMMCIIAQPVAFLIMSTVMVSFFHHFFIPRHVMHGFLLLWLGIAIVIPRINKIVYFSCLTWLIITLLSSYTIVYNSEYNSAPLLEETKDFIAANMQPGDVVLYDYITMDTLYEYYMPEQEFIFWEEKDIDSLKGKRIWFVQWAGQSFTQEEKNNYQITMTHMGHFGFQVMFNFDIWKIEIPGGEY